MEEEGKWRGFGAACLLMICAGNVYAFGLWSDGLAEHWPKDEPASEGSTLYEAALVGVYLPFAGFFYDRFGTTTTLLVSAVMTLLAYFGIWFQFFARDGLFSPNWFSFLCFFMAGHATGYIDAAVVGTSLGNLEIHERGMAMGVLKGYFGLSASILSTIYSVGVSTGAFVLLLGVGNTFIILVASSWLVPLSLESSTPHATPSKWKLQFALNVQILMAILLFLRSMFLSGTGAQSMWVARIFVLFAVPALLSNMALPKIERVWHSRYRSLGGANEQCSDHGEERRDTEGAADREGSATLRERESSSSDHLIEERRDSAALEMSKVDTSLNLWAAVQTVNFWLLFLQLLFVMGAGLLLIGDAGLIMKAKFGSQADVNSLVSIISVSNCFGRLVAGYLADLPAAHARGVYRTTLLALALVVMGSSHLIFPLAGVRGALFAGALGGFAYGASWTLNPTILADICGMKYFGQLYGVLGLAPTVGSFLFSTLLASRILESHTHVDEQGKDICTGGECFALTHMITAVFCIGGGVCLGTTLHVRTVSQYRFLYSEH